MISYVMMDFIYMCMQVEDDCKLNCGEEIATAVKQILAKIHTEGGCVSPNYFRQ